MDFQGTWRHVDKVIETLLINCDKATFLLLCTWLPPNCHCLMDFLFIHGTSCASTTVLILFTCAKAFFGGINGVSCSLIIIVLPSLQWMRFLFGGKRGILTTMEFLENFHFSHPHHADFPGSTAPISSRLSLPVVVYFVKANRLYPVSLHLKLIK
jgi:hypothetical protein